MYPLEWSINGKSIQGCRNSLKFQLGETARRYHFAAHSPQEKIRKIAALGVQYTSNNRRSPRPSEHVHYLKTASHCKICAKVTSHCCVSYKGCKVINLLPWHNSIDCRLISWPPLLLSFCQIQSNKLVSQLEQPCIECSK